MFVSGNALEDNLFDKLESHKKLVFKIAVVYSRNDEERKNTLNVKNQYEQHCSAAALKQMGILVVRSIKEKNFPKIEAWLNSRKCIEVDYPNER